MQSSRNIIKNSVNLQAQVAVGDHWWCFYIALIKRLKPKCFEQLGQSKSCFLECGFNCVCLRVGEDLGMLKLTEIGYFISGNFLVGVFPLVLCHSKLCFCLKEVREIKFLSKLPFCACQ